MTRLTGAERRPDPIADQQFYAGVAARRLAAFAIDLAVVAVIMGGLISLGFVLGFLTFGIGLIVIIPALAIAGFVYRYTLITERSATLGMMAMGIELRDGAGQRLDGMTAALHTLAFTAMLHIPFALLASLVFSLINPRGQLLHDVLFGTVMINRPL
ncbi:MAG: RDD family protein [Pseudomonadota bacterium]